MAHRLPTRDSECPVEQTLAIIGGKWKPMIIYHLLQGTHRFGQLRRKIPGATQQMLTAHLRELEIHGVVQRTVYPQVPPKVEYQLTEAGRDLLGVFEAMLSWAMRYGGNLPACETATPSASLS